jgi:hypothetical protein
VVTLWSLRRADCLRIAAFDACMIAGHPFDESRFFEIACGSIEGSRACRVESCVTTLGGFPVTRAERYRERLVMPFEPSYVVRAVANVDGLKRQAEIDRRRPKERMRLQA